MIHAHNNINMEAKLIIIA